jgi:serine/threonine protein kinase/tetratricopeptide (TPR) repeat protein
VIGRTISHYKITRQLGAGGMGVVYEAVDTKLDRTVALKFLPPESTRDPEAKARFVHEAKAASALDHHNVCVVHEIGETDDGQMFLAMARYEGETLKDRIARGPLPLDDALDICRQVAEGLAKAHEREIVHRDIKPANIFLTEDGMTKILDFGLAKLEGQTLLTKTGTTLGTAGYMSPEQARGEVTDQRTDLWCLGVVLYEMVTGRLPFPGDQQQAIVYGILNLDPEPVTGLRSGVPVELERVIGKCLAKDPAERYQGANELLADLTRLRREMAQGKSVPGQAQGTIRQSRRWPLVLGIVGLVAVLAISGWLSWGPGKENSQPVEPALAVVDFTDPTDEEGRIRATGLRNLVRAGLVENCPMRVISTSLLQDIRRREYGEEEGPIKENQALEVSRKAGASHLLLGHIAETGPQVTFIWEIVETASGESVDAGQMKCKDLLASSGAIVEEILPQLAANAGLDIPADRILPADISTDSPEAYRFFTMGLLAREEGRFEDGIRQLNAAIAADSLFALAHFELARSTYGVWSAGQSSQLKSDFHRDRAWQLRERLGLKDRLRLEAWMGSGSTQPQDNDWRDNYSELLARWPDDLEILRDFCGRLFYKNFFTECVGFADQGLIFYPEDPLLFNLKLFGLLYAGGLGEAESMIPLIRGDLEDNGNVWDNVGELHLALGNPEAAESAFRKSHDLSPDPAWLHLQLGKTAFARGDFEEMAEHMIFILAQPDLPNQSRNMLIADNFFGIADLWGEAGKFSEGHRLLDLYEASMDPDDDLEQKHLALARARLYFRAGRFGDIVDWLETDPPPLSETRANDLNYFRGCSEVALGRLEAARRTLDVMKGWDDRGLRKSRDGLLFLSADLALAAGQPARAIEFLNGIISQGALAFLPQGIDWRRARAAAYMEAGDLEAAAEELRHLLKVFGGHALGHFELGKLYEEMGRPVDAENEYEIFLKMWSGADQGLPQVEMAEARLATLKSSP